MFDCGNSKSRRVTNSGNDCGTSVSTSCRSVIKHPKKKCIESDLICELIDELRYSGRRVSRRYELDDRRYSGRYDDDRRISTKRSSKSGDGCCESKKEHSEKPVSIRLDGGTSTSIYPAGPVVDLGTSAMNPPSEMHCHPKLPIYPTVMPLYGGCNDMHSGTRDTDERKMVIDGGYAGEHAC